MKVKSIRIPEEIDQDDRFWVYLAKNKCSFTLSMISPSPSRMKDEDNFPVDGPLQIHYIDFKSFRNLTLSHQTFPFCFIERLALGENEVWGSKRICIIRYSFKRYGECRRRKDCLRLLNCRNLPTSFSFTDCIRGSQVFPKKNFRESSWSVWRNVTTGIIKKGN
jgi:hypothetical protein